MRAIFLACICICTLPPSAVAADDAMVAAGGALFADLCADCHGADATDGEAGDIRRLPASIVSNATQGFEMMPAFDLAPDEITAIAAWLAKI